MHISPLPNIGGEASASLIDGFVSSLTGDSDPRETPLSMPASVILLPSIHDCAELHRRIGHDEPRQLLDDATTGPRRDHVLIQAGDGLRSYDIDGATSELLDLFSTPTSYLGACLTLASQADAPMPAWEDVHELVRLGVLQPDASVVGVSNMLNQFLPLTDTSKIR